MVSKHIQFLFSICALLVKHSRDKHWVCDLTLKKSLRFPQPTPCSTSSDILHKRKKKISTVACHSSFSDKDFWIGYILLWISDWFISYFKMHHSRALFWFWWEKKKSMTWMKILLLILERLIYWVEQGKNVEGYSKSLIIWVGYLVVELFGTVLSTHCHE